MSPSKEVLIQLSGGGGGGGSLFKTLPSRERAYLPVRGGAYSKVSCFAAKWIGNARKIRCKRT